MAMNAAIAYLRKIRILRKITQGGLAQAIGVHRRTIERFESNQGTVAADSFLKIIEVLRASGEDVFQLALDPTASTEVAEERAAARVIEQAERQVTPGPEVILPEQPWQQLPPGVRAYVRTLRESAGYSLRVVELLTFMPAEQWLAWEEGRIVEVPTKALFVMVADLNGSLDNVLKLIETNASEEEGRVLAQQWLRQYLKEPSVPISDEWDAMIVRHARRLTLEQKQRVLEYTNWMEQEVTELQLILQEVETSSHSRAEFARILELSQQLEAALDSAMWIDGERWLWHVARIRSLNRERRRIPSPTEPEQLQKELERVITRNQG